ncbi:phosphoglucomutase/phosphomannomutase family protein [Lewinella sp. W8]|uniref:phosphoglucomutase/phosphomannomutase family protein n=1 Tax=Lewinella sp. W8 TaxID=2528208 RepID=UPI001067846D|nr:phosphoglucomutase/phosphomannomutase family protein [Lewinella sp. W8]MTB52972.1 phosphoglucomutase/phosphomannomutase family protein [Lewinella sp. W8]
MQPVKIKFGTDGWRAIIAQEYTVDNVKRVAEGTAQWLKSQGGSRVVIGYDCRFAGKLFTETTARVLGKHGITSLVAPDFISTPMVSLGVVKAGADLGVVITASHNPPSYNGYKLKSKLGGPSVPADVSAVEELIPDEVPQDLPTYASLVEQGLVEEHDFEQIYLDHVYANFDVELIRSSGIGIAYDAMYGAGQSAMQRLLPNATHLHCEINPGFNGQAPEPIGRNLQELSDTIKQDDRLALGIANDGDADRIGLFDEDGEFVDSHHILLLLLMYQYEYKNIKQGEVILTFSVTDKLKKLAKMYGLPFEVTKIGFKYIAEIMAERDVIVGGEESGGLAVSGHIPERDGIWIGLMIAEYMAKTGKSLKALIADLYEKVGSFHNDRDDVHVENDRKWAIVKQAKEDPFTAFGAYEVSEVAHVDGSKFYLGSEDRWVMVRPSGTEPVLRVYAQGADAAEVRSILDAARKEMGI